MTTYGTLEYWEERYNKESEQFDWMQRFGAPNQIELLRDAMEKHMKTHHNILIIGCGTSRMAEELLECGYSKIV